MTTSSTTTNTGSNDSSRSESPDVTQYVVSNIKQYEPILLACFRYTSDSLSQTSARSKVRRRTTAAKEMLYGLHTN